MKSFYLKTITCLVFCLPFLLSCNWQDLPSYDEAEISALQFYFRWASDDEKDAVTGEPVVKERRLETTYETDSKNAVVTAVVRVPDASGEFTESVRSSVSQSRLWGQVTVSTAARITPVDGSGKLGTPDDWTKERKFEVQAADGTVKVWTIRVTDFIK